MNKLHIIHKGQSRIGASWIQRLINSGEVWKMEGSMGRTAMSYLEQGICYLPLKSFTDYYGNKIPSRAELQEGTKGTITNSLNYYENL